MSNKIFFYLTTHNIYSSDPIYFYWDSILNDRLEITYFFILFLFSVLEVRIESRSLCQAIRNEDK